MSVKPIIKCNCGQRIVAKDVLQTGHYLRLFGPSFVYVKFRCSRCKKLGEQFVEQDKWDETVLRDVPSEQTPEERKRFQSLGQIDMDEVIDFHFALDELKSLEPVSPQQATKEDIEEEH